MAAKKALETAERNGITDLEIRTDSDLLVKSMNSWIPQWKKNNWKTSTGKV